MSIFIKNNTQHTSALVAATLLLGVVLFTAPQVHAQSINDDEVQIGDFLSQIDELRNRIADLLDSSSLGSGDSGLSSSFGPQLSGGGGFGGGTVFTTDRLNVRASSSAEGSVVGTVPAGSTGVVIGESVRSGLYEWYPISYDNGVRGWSAENWLRSGEPTSRNSFIYNNRSDEPVPTYDRSRPTFPEESDLPEEIDMGDTVTTRSAIVLQTNTEYRGPVAGIAEKGSVGSVISIPVDNGLDTWYQIRFRDGTTGWAQEGLMKYYLRSEELNIRSRTIAEPLSREDLSPEESIGDNRITPPGQEEY